MHSSLASAPPGPGMLPGLSPQPPTSPPATNPAPPQTPAMRSVLGALGGMVLLCLAATLGSGQPGVIIPGSSLVLASLLGAMLLTAPALLALHQFLQLSARPEAMVAALAQALVAGGKVAAGMAPVGLFFAATTSLWPAVLLLGFALCGVVTAIVGVASLRSAEAAVAPVTSRFSLLLTGWAGLTTLIALRIGFDVLTLTFENVLP